jgi:hypothetical protein
MFLVAAFAANAAGVSQQTITATPRLTSSPASEGNSQTQRFCGFEIYHKFVLRTPAQVRADQCRLDHNTTADLKLVT